MNLSSRNLFKLAILAFMMTDFALLACKTSVSKTKDSGSADPVCFANYGSGYGQIYQCGDKYCAKQHPDYTVQCVVDNADPCHGVAVSSASSGESVDTSQPVWDVGSGMYFNACTANGGQGYGTPWSCGNAQCANVTAASPSYTFCRVSGGSLVPADQVSSKLQTVATSDQQTQECTARANKQSSASSASQAPVRLHQAPDQLQTWRKPVSGTASAAPAMASWRMSQPLAPASMSASRPSRARSIA